MHIKRYSSHKVVRGLIGEHVKLAVRRRTDIQRAPNVRFNDREKCMKMLNHHIECDELHGCKISLSNEKTETAHMWLDAYEKYTKRTMTSNEKKRNGITMQRKELRSVSTANKTLKTSTTF